MDLGEGSYDLLFHDPKDDSSQNGPPDRSNAPDNRHKENVHAGLKSKHALRMDERRIARKNAAGHSG